MRRSARRQSVVVGGSGSAVGLSMAVISRLGQSVADSGRSIGGGGVGSSSAAAAGQPAVSVVGVGQPSVGRSSAVGRLVAGGGLCRRPSARRGRPLRVEREQRVPHARRQAVHLVRFVAEHHLQDGSRDRVAPHDVVVHRRCPTRCCRRRRCPTRCCRRRCCPRRCCRRSVLPHTMLSTPSALPQTMLSSPFVAPHDVVAVAPPQSLPQTMLSSPSLPQTMLSSSPLPQTMLSSSPLPHTMLSPSVLPQTMLSSPSLRPRRCCCPRRCCRTSRRRSSRPRRCSGRPAWHRAPHDVVAPGRAAGRQHAAARRACCPRRCAGSSRSSTDTALPCCALRKYSASCTAPRALRKPAPCVSAL